MLADVQHDSTSRRVSYSGDRSVRRDVNVAAIIPVCPEPGSAAVVDVVDHIGPHLASIISDPAKCLKPMDQWPERTPRSYIFGSDAEWFKVIRAAFERGMMALVAEEKLFKIQFGVPVFNGAMAVDKPRR